MVYQQMFTNQDEQKYHSQRWREIFQKMQAFLGAKIIFEWNYAPQIIKDVVHIDFLNLKQISFGANRIGSIEGIVHLNAPCLKQLTLSNNQICNFNSLRKAHFPLLEYRFIENPAQSSDGGKHPMGCQTLIAKYQVDLQLMLNLGAQSKKRISRKSTKTVFQNRKIGGM